MAQGIGSHGTIIEFKPAVGSAANGTTALVGTWVTVSELGDIQMPGTTRNEFDITSHNIDIDTYVMGVQRRDPVTFPMFFNKNILAQVALREQQFNGSQLTNMTVGFRVTSPDGDVIVFSGGVKEFKRTNPVDGVQTANVTIRASGAYSVNGVTYGS